MPAVPRDMSLTYGSYTVGGNTDVLLDSWTRVEDHFSIASYEMSFIVTGSTDAAFATACANAEAAFRIPRQDLVVSQGAATLKSLKQSDNTGLDCDPKIMKMEHMADTGRSRRYTVRLDFGRPADNIGTSGRRSTTTLVQYSESRRRTVTVAGIYTAIPSSGTALAQYLSTIDAWALTQLQTVDPQTGISVFWELVDEPRVEFNSTNKVMEFSRSYKEKIYPDAGQTTSTMDDPDLVNQSFKVSFFVEGNQDSPGQGVDWTAAGGGISQSGRSPFSGTTSPTVVDVTAPGSTVATGSTARLGRILATYEAGVNSDNTIDLVGKYNNVIRAWMFSELKKVVASGYGTILAIMKETPTFDRDDNRIHVEMEAWVAGPAHIIEQKISTKESKPSYGHVLVPRWDGVPLSKYRYQGPAQQLRIITENRRVLGSPTSNDLGKEPVVTASSVPVSRDVEQTPIMLGAPGNQFLVTDITIVTVVEFYSSGGGGSAPPPSSGMVATQSPGTNFFPPGSNIVT